ncbi:MAG: serine hydrolase domain-containing protein [bacterium]|nr:serine hydrolase domain-containing protein [bacterium]
MAFAQAALMRLDQFITLRMREHNVPAVSIAMTDQERTVFVSVDGVADVAGRMPVVQDTLFEIGSLSKSFTAIAVMQEVEAGRLDLHVPVQTYLPWFGVQSPFDQPITLHHLLTHSSGIITGQNFAAGHPYEVYALRETRVYAPPGTYFHYSDVGYKLLGLVLERLNGRPYPRIIEERILDPLGMEVTAPAITHLTRKRMATGYTDFYDDRPAPMSRPLAPATWLQYGAADGSIASTASDMAIYVRMLLNRGVYADGRLISEDSFALMTTPHINGWNLPYLHYGYGLVMSTIDGCLHIGHEGGMVGYSSSMLMDMESGLGVVLLSNHPNSHTFSMADFGLKTQRAARSGGDLPPLPGWNDLTRIENAADYAGEYRSATRTLTFRADEHRLILDYDYEEIVLDRRGKDYFYAPHAAFALYLLAFGRDAQDRVTELFYGGEHFVHADTASPASVETPPEWDAFTGRYRSHNPWLTNFAIVKRRDKLLMLEPTGFARALVPMNNGCFRVDDDERSPEWIQFDTIIEGQALRANFSGCDYYRFFTP